MLTLKTNTMKYKNADGVMQDVGAIIGEKTTDASLSQAGFPADAKAVGEKFSQLQDTVSDLKNNLPTTGSGMTQAQINALDGMFKVCAYDSTKDFSGAYTAFKQAFGIESGGTEPDNPDIPDEPDTPEVTLSSISATYTGGNVAVGTALTDLTGITVTAHYSDGNASNVTGYTLSGTIAEGNNTITVSYGGKTTTFTVTGIAEEEPDVPVTSLRGHVLAESPTTWGDEANWKRENNGSVIGNLMLGQTEGTQHGWAYIARPFTGTVYVRSLAYATNINYSYTDYMIIADNETAIQNPSYDTLSSLKCSDTRCIFEIDGVANQQFVVKKDGSYEQKTGVYFECGNIADAYGIVNVQKFEIPEGKIGYLCCNKQHNDNASHNSNSRWMNGVNAVFFENPYNNPTATVQEVTS